VVSVTFAVGIVFELPALVYVLARLGLVTAAMMKNYRKAMVVVIFVLSAIITPPDMFSMIMVAIPMYLLYEASILIAARTAAKGAA
jgi:sec-independent protein translocase protein TatC